MPKALILPRPAAHASRPRYPWRVVGIVLLSNRAPDVDCDRDVIGFAGIYPEDDLVHACPLLALAQAAIEADRIVTVRDRQARRHISSAAGGNLTADTSTQ